MLVAGVAEGCRLAGCALVGGEMAEHPGAMTPGEFDLVGFAVGAVAFEVKEADLADALEQRGWREAGRQWFMTKTLEA